MEILRNVGDRKQGMRSNAAQGRHGEQRTNRANSPTKATILGVVTESACWQQCWRWSGEVCRGVSFSKKAAAAVV